jgi:hypothetical protein
VVHGYVLSCVSGRPPCRTLRSLFARLVMLVHHEPTAAGSRPKSTEGHSRTSLYNHDFKPIPWSVSFPSSFPLMSKPLTFQPLNFSRTLAEIRSSIPPHLFIRDTTKSMSYLARDITLAASAWYLATLIDPYLGNARAEKVLTPLGVWAGWWGAWAL